MNLVLRLKAANLNIGGLLCKRVYQDGALVGYNGLDLSSNKDFPLIRLRNNACGSDWVNFRGLKYVFSASGFKQANYILKRSFKGLSSPYIVFVDEFGRLEKAGQGIYSGIISIVDSLRCGDIVIFLCRTDMVESVERLIKDHVQSVTKCEPSNFMKLWDIIQGCISLTN